MFINWETVLYRAKDYYKNTKEVLREKAKYKKLSEEKKHKERMWKK